MNNNSLSSDNNENQNVSMSLPKLKLRSEFASNTIQPSEESNFIVEKNKDGNDKPNIIVQNTSTNPSEVQMPTEMKETDTQKGGMDQIKQDIRNLLS